MWNYGKIVCINLLLLIMLLLISEGVYRYFWPNSGFCTRTFPGQRENRKITWARPDADLGWVFGGKNFHTFTNRHYREKAWTATFNREGFRANSDFREIGPKAQSVRIMLLGDSFLFGVYLNDSDTLSSLLHEKLGVRYEVYNFGIPGWGLDQMLLAYKKYVDIVDPDFVIIVYLDNDVLRVFESFRVTEGLNKPSFKLDGGGLALRGADKPGFLDWISGYSILVNRFYCTLYKYYESRKISEAIFLELSKETKLRDQKLIVVRYPGKAEVLGNRKRNGILDFKDFLRRKNIMYLDSREEMRAQGEAIYRDFYLKRDGHPAREGNNFIADYILKKAFADH